MTRRVAGLAALLALVPAGTAVAASFGLPSPDQGVPFPPPLGPGAAPQSTTELRVPGRVASTERIMVGLGPTGAPVRVEVAQRLVVNGTGDYSFVVTGPVISVRPGPGSASVPGLRDVGILWQGFSDRRRVLAVDAILRPVPASAALPLRVQAVRRGDSTVLRLVDVARRRMTVVVGKTPRARLVALVRHVRSNLRLGQPVAGLLYIVSNDARYVKVGVSAPLRLDGVISAGSWRRAVHGSIGGAGPAQRRFVIPGTHAPTLRLRVSVPQTLDLLPTPSALAHTENPLRVLQAALNAAAISRAYRRFLSTPDPGGPSAASYLYSTVTRARATIAPRPRSESHTLAILLAVLLGGSGLIGLAMLWARS